MKISSFADLENLESQIKAILQQHKLGDVLYSLHLHKASSPPMLKPFMVAGLSLLAIRFCPPSNSTESANPCDIQTLINLSNNYYLADPIVFDQNVLNEFKSKPIFTFLRIISSQFPFAPSIFSEFTRPVLLFDEIPNRLKGSPHIPHFDFKHEFETLTEVSVLDFITTGFVITSVSRQNFTFTQNYLNDARQQGINLPNDYTVKKILNNLAADKEQLIELYEKRKNTDRRFKMYDFNPLLSYPLIKPCQDSDYMHAPVPELLGSRMSIGIFYQMYNAHATSKGNKFADYFGYVFETYVGDVLKNSITSQQLMSELDIREFYPQNKGKVPDWILIDGSTLVLFECKATRFSRQAQAIANEKAITDSLAQVIKGLIQLHAFISACRARIPELEKFHNYTTFQPILVTLEDFHLINDTSFRDHINTILSKEDITDLDWQIISIDDLEALQPHIVNEIRLSEVLHDLKQKTFNDVLDDLISKTHKTFYDCFLYPKQQELERRIGLSI